MSDKNGKIIKASSNPDLFAKQIKSALSEAEDNLSGSQLESAQEQNAQLISSLEESGHILIDFKIRNFDEKSVLWISDEDGGEFLIDLSSKQEAQIKPPLGFTLPKNNSDDK